MITSFCIHLWTLAFFVVHLIHAQSFYPVKWSSKTYGLDGPWYAVSASVGGYDDGTQPLTFPNYVDLLPGSAWYSVIPSPQTCNNTPSADCGAGGTWDPSKAHGGMFGNQTSTGYHIGMIMSDKNFAGDMRYMDGLVYSQRLNLNAQGTNNFPQLQVPNSTLVVTGNGTMRWPNGRITGLDIGSLALGADDARMNFTWTNNAADNTVTYNVPGYLSLTNQASRSHSIHIGSTAMKYAPSLIFGGYDQGRGIGNVVSWSSSALTLNDIVLGVETGGSPWDFSAKTGLLLNNMSTQSPLPVYVDPISPYLHLPDSTCKNLAQYLPIYFDDTSQYYLWNTSSPAYTKMTSSAAYLGFVFPPSFGSLDPVTIKVPMIYLNLTLQPEVSGLGKPVPYFPCQNYYPDYAPLATAGSLGGTYTLGRAFLQSALLGRNWSKGISWLAQAPGPGAEGIGLGYKPVVIKDDDTTISISSDSTLFNATMQGHWRPLPVTTVAIPTSTSSSNITSNLTATTSALGTTNQNLSTVAKAGIGVGIAVVILAALLAMICLIVRRRRRASNAALKGQSRQALPPYVQTSYDYALDGRAELQAKQRWELSARRETVELDSRYSERPRYELAEHGRWSSKGA